jgi:hypothetical protein
MKACGIQPKSWEDCASSRTIWKQQVAKSLKESEMTLRQLNSQKRTRKLANQNTTGNNQ